LAKKYHPDNQTTGNSEKFTLISNAYKVLSDLNRRTAFDVKYEEYCNRRFKMVDEVPSSDGFENDQHIRNTILSILYIEKRQDPLNSGVGLWRLEQIIGWPETILEFHVWYLKEKGWIQRTDMGGYAITAGGVDVIEEKELTLGKDRLLPQFTDSSEGNRDVKHAQNKKNSLLKVVH
jgi:curved DNA-binding protein CbpA